MNALTRTWYQKHPIRFFLMPMSWFYRMIVAIRRMMYRVGLFKTTHFDVPVIVVGNLTVGGTGKTPAVIALVEALKKQGKKPGIVSRGYKSRAKSYPAWVTPESDPFEMGDEPVLIARRTGRPVVVAPKRVQAVRELLKNSDCDVVVSDDGLQHYALGRDKAFAVVDQVRGFGNGLCLPAGPLREPMYMLKHFDLVILNQGAVCRPDYPIAKLDLKGIPSVPMALGIDGFKGVRDGQPVELKPQKVHAIAGIGHPERFFDTLRGLGFEPITHTFPDHYRYRATDIAFPDGLPILMTEKDAIKCKAFADERCYHLPITANIEIKNLF